MTAVVVSGFDAAPVDPLVDMIRRFVGGHEPAFTDFYRAVGARVFGLVNRVLQNSALSAEVTQDVFVELWTQADRYDATRGSVLGWVFTIAHRRAIDSVRHEERSHRRDTRYTVDHPGIAGWNADDHVQHKVEEDRVRGALNCLTDRQREAVKLAYFGGYSGLEMARILGIPVATVKSRIRAGSIRLRVALDDEGLFGVGTDA